MSDGRRRSARRRAGLRDPDRYDLPPIAVALPQAALRVSGPITITGSADVFEATVNIRVLDGNGEVLAESFAMATRGNGCRGDFGTQIKVPIDSEQPGTIQVFEQQREGRLDDQHRRDPRDARVGALVPETKGLEGTRFDGNDVPIPIEFPLKPGGNAMAVVRGSGRLPVGVGHVHARRLAENRDSSTTTR